jgi:hypothetical protein
VCFDGFDGKIISLYAGAMTTREIQGHLEEIYGVEVSPGLISAASDAVLEEVRVWQTRPLEAVYPILYLDALIVKVKEQGRVINKSVYLAIGANLQGLKEVLGIWIAETEEARILAGDCDRVANARRRGYSRAPGSTLSGASAAAFFELRLLQRAERSCRRLKVDLQCRHFGRSRKPRAGICRKMGKAESGRCSFMAGELGARCANVPTCAGNPPGGLYDRRH